MMWVLSIFFSLIAPIIFFLVAKDQPYLKRQAALSAVSALALMMVTSVSWMMAAASMVAIVTSQKGVQVGGFFVGVAVICAASFAHLVVCLLGAVATSKSEPFSPPLLSWVVQSVLKM